jgi:hypothetical protein
VAKAKNAATLSAHVPNRIIAEVERRAAALSMPKSSYAAKVWLAWEQQGFPAVTPADAAMQDLAALQRAKAAEPPAAAYGERAKKLAS